LQSGLKAKGFNLGHTNSPVTPVFLSGSVAEATNVVIDLRENYRIFCSMVIYPVVPKDVIMLRIIPTSAHTVDDAIIPSTPSLNWAKSSKPENTNPIRLLLSCHNCSMR